MALDPNVQLILGGFDSAARGLQPTIDREAEEAKRNRPLTNYEKWLGKVLSGELSPEQAATHAKLEQNGMLPGQTPQGLGGKFQFSNDPYQPGNQQSTQPGVAAPVSGLSRSTQVIGGMADQTLPTQPQRISQVSGPVSTMQGSPFQTPETGGGLGDTRMAPQTAGDFQALMGAAPFLRSMNRGPTQEEIWLKLLQEQGRNSRAQLGSDTRVGIADANREQQGGQFAQMMQYRYDALNALNQRAQRLHQIMSQRAGSANDIALLRIKAQQIGSMLQAQSREIASPTIYGAPQAQQGAAQLDQQIGAAMQDFNQTLDMLNQKYVGPNAQPQTPTTNISTTVSGSQGNTAPAAPNRSRLSNLFGK